MPKLNLIHHKDGGRSWGYERHENFPRAAKVFFEKAAKLKIDFPDQFDEWLLTACKSERAAREKKAAELLEREIQAREAMLNGRPPSLHPPKS